MRSNGPKIDKIYLSKTGILKENQRLREFVLFLVAKTETVFSSQTGLGLPRGFHVLKKTLNVNKEEVRKLWFLTSKSRVEIDFSKQTSPTLEN